MNWRIIGLGLLPFVAGCGGQSGAGAVPPSAQECAICHSFSESEPAKTGPNLFDVIGAKAGTRGGYAYSAAMKGSGITWTPASLDAFIAAPQKVVPGTRMGFAGEPDAAKRQAIIGYIQSESAKGAKQK